VRCWSCAIVAACIAQMARLEHRFYRHGFAAAFATDYAVRQVVQGGKAPRGGLDDNAATVAVIRQADGKTETRKRIERPADRRLAKAQRLGKAPHGVGAGVERHAKKYRGLSRVEIGPIGPNSFSEYILEKGKRGSTVHKQLRFASPGAESRVIFLRAQGEQLRRRIENFLGWRAC
jgi:hypothetical protein